ncbi:hypothetical protein DL768_010560 [Monosporascus sp. mg162]|nr:hypothetical protein DL768_010560 [Monosporascus sp. mg162]
MKGDELPYSLGVCKDSYGEYKTKPATGPCFGTCASVNQSKCLLELRKVKSVFREGVRYALKVASAHPESSKFLLRGWGKKHHDYPRMLLSGPEPWLIPTECNLDRMFRDIGYQNVAEGQSTKDYWESNCGKYRFSAAATAIHFLRSIPNSRCHIRKILLCEDYEAVAYPECHAKGLIPFCRENPELRIERRVSLWRNIFQKSHWWDGCDWERRVDFPCDREGRLAADEVTRPVADWMVEASVLGRAGMPQDPGTFTLILDGDPTPERSSEVFCLAVQRDAAWQDAVEQCLVRDPLNWSNVLDMRLSKSFHVVGFPQLLRHLASDKSSSGIRCNFDPGEPWDIAPIIEANRGWNQDDWFERSGRPDLVFETAPPLPKWADLVRENIFPRIWELEEWPEWELEEWEIEELERED